MNHTEINYAIAKARGLNAVNFEHSLAVWIFPDDDKEYKQIDKAYIVDYTTDPVRILELQMELLENSWKPARSKVNKFINAWREELPPYKEVENEDFGLATALAWLKMKGIEV